MGIQNGQEMARQVVTGTLSTVGQASTSFSPDVLGSLSGHPLPKFTASLWVASGQAGPVVLQRSFDGGVNWVDGREMFSGYADTLEEAEPGVAYRFLAATGFAGPITYRFSQ